MTKTGAYTHSPKIIVIAGAPAAGKSTAAAQLRDQLGYSLISLDGINAQVATKLGLAVEDLRTPHPQIVKAFTTAFLERVRELRYCNIVLEGCRVSHSHIFETFRNAVYNAYGEYTLFKCFYLCPDQEQREKQYLLRQAKLAKQAARDHDTQALEMLKQEHQKGFCAFLEPPLPEFEVVKETSAIVDYATTNAQAKHPALPPEHEELLRVIAQSKAFNPFYQRVEIGGEVVIGGFTESEKTLTNIRKFNLDFTGRSVLDIGCMLGYYCFKLEELGAQAFGIDIDAGAIEAAKAIARARGSSAVFSVTNSELRFDRDYDVILALNVLHRVSDCEAVCRNIFNAARTTILEIGEAQIKDILTLGKPLGFRMKQIVKSHRSSDVIGQRMLVCLTRG